MHIIVDMTVDETLKYTCLAHQKHLLHDLIIILWRQLIKMRQTQQSHFDWEFVNFPLFMILSIDMLLRKM